MLFDRINWREVAVINDAEQYEKIARALQEKGIQYRVKTQNMGYGNRRSGGLGSLGENQRFICIFNIYVKKSDLEKANYICRNIR